MTMEKYGADFKDFPVTDDQIRTLNKLASEQRTTYAMPKSRAAADLLIEEMEKQGAEHE